MAQGGEEGGEGILTESGGGEVAEGCEATRNGNGWDAGSPCSEKAVFGIFNDEAVSVRKLEKISCCEEEGGVRLHGEAVCAAEDAFEEGERVQGAQPAFHPGAGGRRGDDGADTLPSAPL